MKTLLSALPTGYVHHSEWPEYDSALHAPPFLHFVRNTTAHRLEWRLGPIHFHEYRSVAEPTVTAAEHQRGITVTIWRRPLYTGSLPKGWFRFSKKSGGLTGFALAAPEYRNNWSKSARQLAKKWDTLNAAGAYSIERVSFDEFKSAYLQSTAGRKVGSLMIAIVERLMAAHPEQIYLWGVRASAGADMYAGIATIQSPTTHSSYYFAGFYSKERQNDPLMVGLMDHWFKNALAEGVQFMHLGTFWQKGDPSSWIGYSLFKSKFGANFIQEAPTLYKYSFKF